MKRQVILHRDEEVGFWVEVPSLPGCYSQGETREEALANIREAIELHIESRTFAFHSEQWAKATLSSQITERQGGFSPLL